MQFIAGKAYYTRNGKIVDVLTIEGTTIVGAVRGNRDHSNKLWCSNGRRSLLKRSPIDLTEAQPVVMDRVVAKSPVVNELLQEVPGIAVGPTYFAAELHSSWDQPFFSPVFKSQFGVEKFVNKYGHTVKRKMILREVQSA